MNELVSWPEIALKLHTALLDLRDAQTRLELIDRALLADNLQPVIEHLERLHKLAVDKREQP